MVSEVNNDLRYLNLVSRVMESCFKQDDEEMFRYPAAVTAIEFPDARRTMSADKFPDFIEYMKAKHYPEYYAVEAMFRKGYRWNDPVSADFGGNLLRKLAYGPEFVLRYYRDHEFQRTGDFVYASISMKKIGNVALLCSLLYGIINPFSILLALWQVGASVVSAEKLISAPVTGNYDFEKLVKVYSRIHKKTSFFILNEVQNYIINDLEQG